jgi:NifB/MoaA-like Fe-S oxidoreductase
LTAHRENLPKLRPFTKQEAAAVIKALGKYKNAFAADEFYLKACIDVPKYEHYGEFPQYENGVGMLAYFRRYFETGKLYEEISRGSKVTVVTGTAAFGFMNELVRDFVDVNVFAVCNDFFGDSVTVCGLLTGGDIVKQLREFQSKGGDLGEKILINATCLNTDGLFLDNFTPADIESALGVKVLTVDS